jgi:hypothetical protein
MTVPVETIIVRLRLTAVTPKGVGGDNATDLETLEPRKAYPIRLHHQPRNLPDLSFQRSLSPHRLL